MPCCPTGMTMVKKLDKTDTEGINLWPDVILNALGPGTEYDFTEDFLLRLFGGKDNRNNPYKTKGCYSAKILRDKMTHELLVTAIEEVFDRWEELSELMDEFLEKFETEEAVEVVCEPALVGS